MPFPRSLVAGLLVAASAWLPLVHADAADPAGLPTAALHLEAAPAMAAEAGRAEPAPDAVAVAVADAASTSRR